ncbi:MAG: cytochrome C [Rhizobium sp.]|nr:MAG: cytochrome C [Rhizobium sp.]
MRSLLRLGCLIILASAYPAAASAQAGPSEALFAQRCQMCHTNSANGRPGIGPNLYGLNGRVAGTQKGFSYSTALKASKVTWNAASLDKFLQAPNKMVPGTRMVIAVPDADKRALLVRYLTKK